MTRGARLTITREQALVRALLGLAAVPTPPVGAPKDAGMRPVHYRLPYPNGGDNPHDNFGLYGNHSCGWANGERVPTMDCIGFVLGAIGIDRRQPGYNGANGEWLNCLSIVRDARGKQEFFFEVNEDLALPGDILVNEKHIGLIVRPKLSWTVDTDGDGVVDKGEERHEDLLVIDCSPRHGRETGIGIGRRWASDCLVARYRFYA